MKRLVALLLLISALVGTATSAAVAADSGSGRGSAATDDGRRSFGLQPAGPKGPDARAFFSYSMTPGAVVTDRLAVVNISDKPATLTVYAADAFNTPAGGFDVAAQGVANHQVGVWLRLRGRTAPLKITVPARSHVLLPIQMKVPRDATPGDHAGGIVASLRTQARSSDGAAVSVDQRVGVRVYARISGALRPHLSVTDLSATYHGSPTGRRGYITASWTVRNDGNVILGGTQAVGADGPFTTVVGPRLAALPALLPGESNRVTARLDSVPRALRLAVTATVHPQSLAGVVNPSLPTTSATVHVWAVPWLAVGLVALILGIAGLAWWLRRRRRRGTGDASGATVHQLPTQSAEPAPARHSAMRAASTVAAMVVVAVAGLLPPGPAVAAAAGGITFLPAEGTDVTPPWIVTDGPCPEEATNLVAVAVGHGFPARGQVVVSNSTSWVRHDAPMVIGLGDSWRGFADINSTELQGRYDVTLRCVDRLLTTSYASFTGAVRFTDGHHFTGPSVPDTVRDEVIAGEQPQSGQTGSGQDPGQPGTAQRGVTGGSTGTDGSGEGVAAGSAGDSPGATSGGSGSGAGQGSGRGSSSSSGTGAQTGDGAQPGESSRPRSAAHEHADDGSGSGVSWLLIGIAALGALLLGGGLLAWRRERVGR